MRLANFIAASSLTLAAVSAQAAEISLGSLTLDWPAGYKLKSSQAPFELAGPGGVKVMVTVMRLSGPAQGGADAFTKLQGTTEKLLTGQALKAGKTVIPLTRDTLPDGTLLQFIGSEASGLFKSGYFLQYALLTQGGPIAFLTFEGNGDVAAQHASAKALFASLRWDAGEGTAAERMAFTERAAAALRTQLDDAATVVIAEPLTLKVGELQANLDRVYTFCRANAEACNAELRRYVLTVADVSKNAAAPVTRESLRAVVRTTAFADAAGPEQTLKRPVVDGLVALPFVDSPDSARLMKASDAKPLGLSLEQTYELALDNLSRSLKPLADVAQPVTRGDIGVVQGDFYESSRVLLHADWAPLARAQGGVLIVALPVKDGLLYSGDDSAAGLDALRARVRDAMRRSPGPLTDLLLRWTESGWQLVR